MVFHPAILALYISSILIGFMVLYSALHGVQILKRWDLRSGSELQLLLERKTYLVSTLLAYAFAFQLASLFLFIYTADHLHTLFVGAMCAAGSLYVNPFGYPALFLKVTNFLAAGLWIILNYADNRGYDYPLIKKKYLLLLLITPFVLLEGLLQGNYFFLLRPDVITSCCGSLFSPTAQSVTSEVASLPSFLMEIVFYLWTASTFAAGLWFYLKGRGGYLFAGLSGIQFLIAVASILSFVSLYFYELPTHHCPFCILQREYGYIGYPLYIALLGSTITGMSVGLLMPFRKTDSLREVIPALQRRLTLVSVSLILVFTAIVTYRVIFSNLILEAP
jgi:hypothetical protein